MSVIDAIFQSLRVAARAKPGDARKLVLADRLEGLWKIKKTGLADEAKRATEGIKDIERASQDFLAVDRSARAALQVAEPSIVLLRALIAGQLVGQSKFALRLSFNDRLTILTELFNRVNRLGAKALEDAAHVAKARVQQGYSVGIAGVMREVHGRNLEPVALSVRRLHLETFDLRKAASDLEVIDSAVVGPVRLPTRFRDGNRWLALGPDRLVGLGRRNPRIERFVLENGEVANLRIEGILDPRIAAEVKGRTTATDGLRQFVNANRRGGQGYVTIGDEFWLLGNYRGDRVSQFLIAPPGKELELAAKEAKELSSLGLKTDLVEIAAEADREMVNIADALVEETLLALK